MLNENHDNNINVSTEIDKDRLYVKKALNEMKHTHFALKEADIVRSLDELERASLIQIFDKIKVYRTSIGKEAMPNHIIINTDENPQMLKEIIEVMKRYQRWG